ncbi:hypothetical protein K488DRAFT_88395 [Vararia minispora EC-137]|uniref:Uncharacterized protein n=1 Tax=Vararia minispora EC-137 TaxID=1314806 RepID=A0ACB8QDD0_9AGAM|nr:hypothetical protein K488DRAFT_88395 [Vararia minispora EC-137]
MAVFRIDKAYLLGAWCAAALWGIFGCFISFALVQVYGLYRRGEVTRSTTITIMAACTLYGLSTAHVSLALRRLIIGFVDIQGPDTIAYFADIAAPINRAKDVIYVTSTVIADSVVVWRCWAIWNGNLYVLVLPILLVMGTAASAYGAVSQYFLANPNPTESVSFGTAMFAVSLTTNVFVTLLSVGRVWWMSRKLDPSIDAHSARSTYRGVIVLLFETGAIIAIAKIFEFIFFNIAPDDGTTGFNALYVVFEMVPQINVGLPLVPTPLFYVYYASPAVTVVYPTLTLP